MTASQPPAWQRSPKRFLETHEVVARIQMQFWKTENPGLELHQFVARYIQGLPADVPANFILEITKILIEVWEKQAVGQKEAVAA